MLPSLSASGDVMGDSCGESFFWGLIWGACKHHRCSRRAIGACRSNRHGRESKTLIF